MYLICIFKKYSMNYVVDPRKLKTKSRVNCVKNAKKAENNSYGKTSLNLARFYFKCVLVYFFFLKYMYLVVDIASYNRIILLKIVCNLFLKC